MALQTFSTGWMTAKYASQSTSRLRFKLEAVEESINVSNNTSYISTVRLKMYCTSSNTTTYNWHLTMKIDGVSYTATASQINVGTSEVTVYTWNNGWNIAHDSLGNKTLPLYIYFYTQSDGGARRYFNDNTDYSFTLTNIPRATTPTLSASSINAGGSLTVTMNRASSSFTHNVYIKFGSTTVASATGQGTSYTWSSVLATECARMPGTTSGTYTVECQTYNGSTLIGTKSATFTVNVPSNVVPTISNSTSVGQDSSAIQSAIGALVQSRSKLKVVISASGIYGSSITSYKTTFNGATYNGQSFNTDYVNTSGNNLPVVITVTDSRGRTASLTRNVTVLPYSAPKITGLTVFRVNTSGTEDDDGERIGITWEYKVSSLNGHNTLTHIHEYRSDDSETFSALASQAALPVSSGSDPNVLSGTTKFTTTPAISTEESYIIRARVWDYFGSSSECVLSEKRLSTAFTLMDFNVSGKGMAVGKVSEEEEGLELNLPTYLYTAMHVRALSGTNDAIVLGRDPNSGGGSFTVLNPNGNIAAQIYPTSHDSGTSYNGAIALNNNSGQWRARLLSYAYGFLQLRDSSGNTAVQAYGASSGGTADIRNSAGTVLVQAYCANTGGVLLIKNPAGNTAVMFNTISHDSGSHYNGRFALNDYSGAERVCAYAYPYGRLAVKGSSGTNDTILLSGNTGIVSCTSVSQSSSRKIKKNIEPISEEEALKLLELEPVSFDFKDEDMGSDQRGFIAEDVKNILPNIVFDEEDGRPMGINYTQLIPYLVKMVQLQQERINELEQRLTDKGV